MTAPAMAAYEVYSPLLPPPPFFGPGPNYFLFGNGIAEITLPAPGLVVNTPRGPVRIDGLPNGTPPFGGVERDGIADIIGGGPPTGVVVPFGDDDRLRIDAFFGISPDPLNGTHARVGIVSDTGGPRSFIAGDLTITFDDGFSHTFPANPAGLSFIGFVKTTGSDIDFFTISSSTGIPAIGELGIGTVPEPGTLWLAIAGSACVLARRRR
jgi:hypothetical protein